MCADFPLFFKKKEKYPCALFASFIIFQTQLATLTFSFSIDERKCFVILFFKNKKLGQ